MVRVILVLCLAAVPLSLVLAGSPVPIKQVAPLGDILLEVNARIAELESLLVSADKFEEGSDEVTEAFGVLACMGQAVAEHEDRAQTPIFGPALRDAALAFADGGYDDARTAFAAIKEAQAGGGNREAEVEFPWGELFAMYPMMDEMEDRGGILTRIARRPGGNPDEPVHASTFAILSLAMHEDTSYIDESDIPGWQKVSLESQQLYTQLATAIRDRDRRASDQFFKKAAATCTDCHMRYRD